jgi:putative ABC transport system permease protein
MKNKVKNRRVGSVFVKFWFTVKMAIHGLIANPLRSFLTILGVSIGVASVVSLMGIGEGARLAVIDQFENLGENVIKIAVHDKNYAFEPDFGDELLERVNNLEYITPVVEAEASLRWRRTRGDVEIIGTNENYLTIRDHELIAGSFFTKKAVDNRLRVAVLGNNIGKSLLNGRSPVGKTITIDGLNYKILGVLSEKGKGHGDNIDNRIIIPYSRALQIAEVRKIETFWGKAPSKEAAALSVVELGRIIKRKIGNFKNETKKQAPSPGGSDQAINESAPVNQPNNEQSLDFLSGSAKEAITITSLNNLIKEADQANQVMTLLLGGIAAVSLLVGGLGVMNIMLVSVSERTAEIGVRRAIGATQGDLLVQFLLEALFLSAVGSISGVLMGILGLDLFKNLGFETAISIKAIRVSTVIALMSGLIFGVYPAISASSIPPVEALRKS